MALITAAQFKEHYPQINGVTEDTLFGTFVARADDLMAAFCGFPLPDSGGHTLEDVTYTIYVDGPSVEHPSVVDLGVKPVVSVTTAHTDENWDYGADTLIASTEYVLDNNRGRLWLRPDASKSWSVGPRSNKVVVVAGFATTPPGLVALCAMTVRHLWDNRGSQGVGSSTIGGDSVTRSDASELLPLAVQYGLGSYRNWGAAVG